MENIIDFYMYFFIFHKTEDDFSKVVLEQYKLKEYDYFNIHLNSSSNPYNSYQLMKIVNFKISQQL